MKNVKAYPVILVPFLISVMIGLIAVVPNQTVSALVTTEMGNISIERLGVNIFDTGAAIDEYGDSELTTAMNAFSMITLIATAFIGPVLISFLYALFLFIFSKIARGQTTFGQMFAMYMHVYVIYAVGALISAFLMSMTYSLVDMTSLAAVLMPNGRLDSAAFNLLNSLNVFNIWATIVMFIGLKTMNDFSNVKAGVITVIVLLGGMGIAVGLFMLPWLLFDVSAALM